MNDSSNTAAPKKKRPFIWILRGIGILLALIALAVVFAMFWIPSDSGRTYVARAVEAYATDGMGGSLTISYIHEIVLFEDITSARVKATDIRFIAPDGRVTMHVGDADVLLDVAALLKGTITIREAIAANGTVTIEIDKNGKLTLENTFVHPVETPAADNLGVNLRHMNARNMRVELKPEPGKTYNVGRIDGTVFVTRPKGGEFVTTELVDVHGTLLSPKIWGDTLRFSKLNGRIANDQTPMVKMSVLLALDEGTIDTRLSVEPKSDPPIKLKMSAEGTLKVNLITAAAKVGSFFGPYELETGEIQDDSK